MSRLLQVLERIALEIEIGNRQTHLSMQMRWIEERAASQGTSLGREITESPSFQELQDAMKRRR